MADDQTSASDDFRRVALERRAIGVVFVIIGLLTLGDLIEDRLDGAPWGHVLFEAGIVCITSVFAVYFIKRSRQPLVHENRVLHSQLNAVRDDLARWKEDAGVYLTGLSTAISRQLEKWNLSEAERDIAMLLLKGFSLKEIAALRETGERTVRQQAAAIYAKSGLGGRAELSAFFLEDLLAPVQKTKDRTSA